MESSTETERRLAELERSAPIRPKSVWKRTEMDGRDVVLLCGTVGAEFDAWQRRLSATSAADAWLSQQIGLVAVERVMDEAEAAARAAVEKEGGRLLPRKSPGYRDMPLVLSREIVRLLDATRKIGVSVTDSDLLVPSKSVTAICETRDRTEET